MHYPPVTAETLQIFGEVGKLFKLSKPRGKGERGEGERKGKERRWEGEKNRERNFPPSIFHLKNVPMPIFLFPSLPKGMGREKAPSPFS